MNTAGLLLGSLVYFLLAYLIYGRFLEKLFGIDSSRPCPSHTLNDGVDYVPTHPAVLFGHHFASIAGAGPIVGPILAAKLGWLPACLWILLGCVFIGAMHDFSALFLSVRNRGLSISYVIEREVGYAGRQLFAVFCLLSLALVLTVFAGQVADTFIKNPSVATSSVAFILIAPCFGILTSRKMLSLVEGTLIFVPIMFVVVWLGTVIPCDLMELFGVAEKTARTLWLCFLFYYAFIASTIPVWFLLQPRDYLNSYLLYAMMIIGIGGILAAKNTIQLPPVMLPEGKGIVPDVMPLLFVTIACGACSGFHALVASGTSSKQLDRESHVRIVGYGGMLLEGVLAIVSICAVGYLSKEEFAALCQSTNNAAPVIFANGVGHFAESLGIPYKVGSTFIALAISAFIMTTLDTAARLGRFILSELATPRMGEEWGTDSMNKPTGWRKVLNNRWGSTLIVVGMSMFLAFKVNVGQIWPIFGSANQLLSALTLLGVALFLYRKKRPWLFALLPMLFMILIAVWALLNLIGGSLRQHNILLSCMSILLIIMAAWLVVLGVMRLIQRSREAK